MVPKLKVSEVNILNVLSKICTVISPPPAFNDPAIKSTELSVKASVLGNA